MSPQMLSSDVTSDVTSDALLRCNPAKAPQASEHLAQTGIFFALIGVLGFAVNISSFLVIQADGLGLRLGLGQG